MSRQDKPATPPYSPTFDRGLHSHTASDHHATERQRQFQNQNIQQSHSTNSYFSAGQTSTPLLNDDKTDPCPPQHASPPQDTNSASQLSPKSTSFNAFRDRLIQQQWQSDREQHWRVEHEPQGLGAFARLPLEMRRQIYNVCFPIECADVDLVEASEQRRPRNGLISLMRSARCIYDEIKPLIERHTESRLFNLVLSKKGVQFERKQVSVDFLTHYGLQSMTPEKIPSLGLFSRSRKSIRNLRLAIQIEPRVTPPPGLVPILEPFAMWVFSLLSTAEALQFLLVEFHLSHDLQAAELAHDDDSEKSIGELIGVLLGSRAAAHCQRVMSVALASELQVVRFVVLQKNSDERQQEKRVTSFRWNRPGRPRQHASQLAPQPAAQPVPQPVPQPKPQLKTQPKPQPIPQHIPQQPVPQPPAHYVAQPVPQPRAQPALQPAPEPAPQPAAKQPEIFSDLSSAQETVPSPATQVGKQIGSPEYSQPPTQVNEGPLELPSRSIENLEPVKLPSNSALPLTIDSASPRTYSSQALLTRHREQETVAQSYKRRRLDLGDRASATEPQAGSSRQTPRPVNSKSRSPSLEIEVDVEEEEYVVQSLRDVRIKNGVPQIKVKWNGYDQMTWEPRAMLMEDVPDMVKEFDKRHWKPLKSGARAKTEQVSPRIPQETKYAAEASNEGPQELIETPRTATARMSRWTAQHSQSSPATSSVQQERKTASQAPKRPLTTYFLYMQANRPSIWDDLCKQLGNPDLVTGARIANEGTRRWLRLEDGEREAWDRIHAKRVAIYHIQMEAYKAGKPIPNQDEARTLVESSSIQTTVVDLT